MVPIDDILAPGRALEALARRAARGQRPAMRVLIAHLPAVLEAEDRWLFPALLRRRPGGARRAWQMSFDAEHEHLLDLLARLAHGPLGRSDALFRAVHTLLLRHVREERAWLAAAHAAHDRLDDPAFARYVAHCRPLLEAFAALDARRGAESAQIAARADASAGWPADDGTGTGPTRQCAECEPSLAPKDEAAPRTDRPDDADPVRDGEPPSVFDLNAAAAAGDALHGARVR